MSIKQQEMEQLSADVLVIGSGLAGTQAALASARTGAQTLLVSEGPLFSGASFYASTWGLGVVGPRNSADIDDFCASIATIGGCVSNASLVRVLAQNIEPTIAALEGEGVKLVHPQRPDEQAYIPCFDTKQRSWWGLSRAGYKAAIEPQLHQTKLNYKEHWTLVDLVREDGSCTPLQLTQGAHDKGSLCGALLWDSKADRLIYVKAAAVVLATGGIAGIFERSLMGPQVSGAATAVAIWHGAPCINLEFLQFMPTIASPYPGLVFNEKSFRYTSIPSAPELNELLEARSVYGPFSSNYPARAIDLAIADAGPAGLELVYDKLPSQLPEFVESYFSWLREQTGAEVPARLRVCHYAHAANGGIAIDTQGATQLAGLFACGEAAGGVHGADRMGGLASAAALVFGRRAGAAAAQYACENSSTPPHTISVELAHVEGAQHLSERLKSCMTSSCGPVRCEEGMSQAAATIAELQRHVAAGMPTTSIREAHASLRLAQQLRVAQSFVEACRARKQSLGSHYRCDEAPAHDAAQNTLHT